MRCIVYEKTFFQKKIIFKNFGSYYRAFVNTGKLAFRSFKGGVFQIAFEETGFRDKTRFDVGVLSL